MPPGQEELRALTGASPRPPTLPSRYLPAEQPREPGIAAPPSLPPSLPPLRNRPRWFLFLPEPPRASPQPLSRAGDSLPGGFHPQTDPQTGPGVDDALTPRPQAVFPRPGGPSGAFLRHKGAHCAAGKSLIPRPVPSPAPEGFGGGSAPPFPTGNWGWIGRGMLTRLWGGKTTSRGVFPAPHPAVFAGSGGGSSALPPGGFRAPSWRSETGPNPC